MEEARLSTKEKIINAAFSFYSPADENTLSLSRIAAKVGISKTAIYRHFKSKDDLLSAMNDQVFTSCARCFEEAGCKYVFDTVKLIPAIAKYLALHPQYFSYFFASDPKINIDRLFKELSGRGIKCFNMIISQASMENLKFYVHSVFVTSTLIIPVSEYVCSRIDNGQPLEECSEVRQLASDVSQLIHNGIGHDLSGLSFQTLEKFDSLCAKSMTDLPPVNPKLEALSRVIAAKGINGFTVEAFADELGLAKSSLYSFFENRNEMIFSLIHEELLTLFSCISENIYKTDSDLEKIYILIQTEFQFFQQRPASLDACKWLQLASPAPQEPLKKKLREDGEKLQKIAVSFFSAEKNFCTETFGEKVFVSWIFLLPLALLLQGREHKVTKELLKSTIRECFLLIERGLNMKNFKYLDGDSHER